MAENEFSASGWLGILTAGLLWTKMWDISTLGGDVNMLVEQIVEAIDPVSRDEAALAEAVTVTEAKDELLRLKHDMRVGSGGDARKDAAYVHMFLSS